MGFEPRLPDCSGCKVSGLQHGTTTHSYSIALQCLVFLARYLIAHIEIIRIKPYLHNTFKAAMHSNFTVTATNGQSASTLNPTAKPTTNQITTTFMKTTTAKKVETTSTILAPTTTRATNIYSTTKDYLGE